MIDLDILLTYINQNYNLAVINNFMVTVKNRHDSLYRRGLQIITCHRCCDR